MTLFHGSKVRIDCLRPQQAASGEGIIVPEGELLEAIYLTPDLGCAIAMAARPEGITHIDDDSKTIEFEHPELFNPEESIYIYEVNIDDLPKEHVRQIDEKQFAIIGEKEIKPLAVQEFKAREVEKYYELRNWKKEGDQHVSEREVSSKK